MLKHSNSYKRFPGYMVFPTAEKVIENKTISFHNEENSVEMKLELVSLSAQGTLNGEWLLHAKVSL